MFDNLKLKVYEGERKNPRLVDFVAEEMQIQADTAGLRVTYRPKAAFTLLKIRAEFDFKFEKKDKVFGNGYQSWTNCREYGQGDKQLRQGFLASHLPLAKRYASMFGDYAFVDYSNPDLFNGVTYSYIKQKDGVTLMGSLNEQNGFTVFYFDLNNGRIAIEKELEGVRAEGALNVFDLLCCRGSFDEVFDCYFDALDIDRSRMRNLAGYTSWYNYFGDINEEIILRDLKGLQRVKDQVNIFQIDDGYQAKTGEWLRVDERKFPRGMRYIADQIHENGLLAGIWIAPFSVAKSSPLVKQHPDWFLKNKKGKITEGVVLSWGGAYTLDIYHPEAREYIRHFFDVILNDWGYDMVKLDFLYSQCVEPRAGKSRGEIMCDAMDFLRECVGEKLILGCGVPLGAAFGRVDLCRISCDVALNYKDSSIVRSVNREVLSAQSAINNTIFRRQLSGRAFISDPDVFFVRRENLKFNDAQRETLAYINNLCGDVLFISDDVTGFDEGQMALLRRSYLKTDRKLVDAEYIDDEHIQLVIEDKDGRSVKILDLTNGTINSKGR